jgi:hypothetical protein
MIIFIICIIFIFYKTIIDDNYLELYSEYILNIYKYFVNNPSIINYNIHFPNHKLFINNFNNIRNEYLKFKNILIPKAGKVYNDEFKDKVKTWKILALRLMGHLLVA